LVRPSHVKPPPVTLVAVKVYFVDVPLACAVKVAVPVLFVVAEVALVPSVFPELTLQEPLTVTPATGWPNLSTIVTLAVAEVLELLPERVAVTVTDCMVIGLRAMAVWPATAVAVCPAMAVDVAFACATAVAVCAAMAVDVAVFVGVLVGATVLVGIGVLVGVGVHDAAVAVAAAAVCAAAVCSAGSTAAFKGATWLNVLPYAESPTLKRRTNGVMGVNEIATVTLMGSPYRSVSSYAGVPGGLGYG
jgi:hypothetical protein